MEVITKETSFKIKKMDLERVNRQIALHILVNISRINLMDKENFLIAMEFTMDNFKIIKNKEMVLTILMMEIYIKVNGIKANNMDLVN